MTTIRCRQSGCEKSIFVDPDALRDHMEEYHNPDAELARELGIEFIDGDLPGRVGGKGFDLDKRVLKLLENQPGVWCKIWTAKEGEEGTRYTKVTRLKKLYPMIDVKSSKWMGDWVIFCKWKRD